MMSPNQKQHEAIANLINIAKDLYNLNNWHSLTAIISALHSALTDANRAAWDIVNEEEKKWFIEIRRIFANPLQLRSKIQSLSLPCIPFFPVYLDWIHEIEKDSDGPLFNNQTRMINVTTMINIGNIVTKVVRLQNIPPNIEPQQEILDSFVF
eukprot:TRINITY_DN745_c2_g3_i4.p1 TRINITY_DN745_c2_g3~~TRINITY_DN745_c2_g3_i4.p1  ORF type:complete len:153 (-),score=26.44 TRINITY_DN745_c2_g3_i4:38-496(-)